MAHINKSYDTHHDLIIQRWGHGIQLIRPSENKNYKNTVSELFSSPFNVFFIDTQSIISDINENTVISCGFESTKSTIGKTVSIAAKKETAEFEFAHDREVMSFNRTIIKEENYLKKEDDSHSTFLNIKFPWYNQQNKLIGVFGIAFSLDSNSIGNLLISLLNTGLLGSSPTIENFTTNLLPGTQIGSVYLSKRASEILQLLIQGKTAKEIAIILNLSYRTIEYYIANLKRKLGVNTKSQLIEKVLQNKSQQL